MTRLETLQAKHKLYTEAAQAHRNNALANEGAAQAVAQLIAEEEEAVAKACEDTPPLNPTP